MDLKQKLFSIAAILFSSLAVASPDGTGLQTSVAVDIVAQAGNANNAAAGLPNQIYVREAEAMLYAPIDHYFDGNLTMAAHQEAGEAKFEIHEAFIGSTRLVPRSRFRVGQYFLGFGRLNQFHRHDWPFVQAPRYQREIFGTEEGVSDQGAEFGWLTPLPFYLDLTFGIANGWGWGEAHNGAPGTSAPFFPTHYLRAATYVSLPDSGGAQIGLNYAGRTDSSGTRFSYLGLDATAKWKESNSLKFLLQSEVWERISTLPGASAEITWGTYIYPQIGLTPELSFGVRGDFYSAIPSSDRTLAAVPTLAFKASEFSTLRLAYTQEWNTLPNPTTNAQEIQFQAMFILGAHPAHDF